MQRWRMRRRASRCSAALAVTKYGLHDAGGAENDHVLPDRVPLALQDIERDPSPIGLKPAADALGVDDRNE